MTKISGFSFIKHNNNSEFLGYDLLNSTFIFNAKDWLISFWIGDLFRGGIALKPSLYFGMIHLWIKNKEIFDSGRRGYVCLPERFPTKPVKFMGWINGSFEDREILKRLGVTGKMTWNEDRNAFGYCEITMDIAKILRDNYPDFIPAVFTALDKNDKQTIHQPLWFDIYED